MTPDGKGSKENVTVWRLGIFFRKNSQENLVTNRII